MTHSVLQCCVGRRFCATLPVGYFGIGEVYMPQLSVLQQDVVRKFCIALLAAHLDLGRVYVTLFFTAWCLREA